MREVLAHEQCGEIGLARFDRVEQRKALKAVAGVTAAFQNAVDGLFARSQDALGSFFSRTPELKPPYDA